MASNLKKPSNIEDSLKLKKERILEAKRNILKLIETLLEKDVPQDRFLRCCEKLSQNDYNDVIEERSIESLCGYPLCSKGVRLLNQKYCIATKTNKVYDITHRKYFCSNKCYRASNYVKAQLSTEPFWLKDDKPCSIKLLAEDDNKGGLGEEVHFAIVPKAEEKESIAEESSSSDLLKKEIKMCGDAFKDLKIREREYQAPCKSETAEQADNDDPDDDYSSSETLTDDSSDESDDKQLFGDYDNLKALSDKYMPLPITTRKTVEISALKLKPTEETKKDISLDFGHRILSEWFTEHTLKYLKGEKEFYSQKADVLFNSMTSSNDLSADKLLTMKNEYVKLCLKLDNQAECDEESDELETIEIKGKLSGEKKIGEGIGEIKHSPEMVKAKKKCKKSSRKKKVKTKSVRFASAERSEDKKCDKNQETSLPTPAMPVVDSSAQSLLRKQLVSYKLKTVFPIILPFAKLSFRDISQEIRQMIDTFNLSPSNVTFKQTEWKLIAVLLLRVLQKTILKDLCGDAEFIELLQLCKFLTDFSIADIDRFVHDVISPQQMQRLQR